LLLTEQGDILFKTVNDILSRLSAAENALIETKERPRGPLKITAPVGFGTMWITPHIREFCEQYPDITVTLLADDREYDLTMREADVAIRLYPARHPDLVQKQLTSLPNSLYASHEYIRANGLPKKPDELSKHKIITYCEDMRLPFSEINWILKTGIKPNEERKSAFKVNSVVAMLKAVESGLGIAGLPDYMAQGITGISRILPDVKGPLTDTYFIYPLELRNSKRINVFRDFILRKLAQAGLLAQAKDGKPIHAKTA
jgi:DNA-binding transcriptional LysR family regulator